MNEPIELSAEAYRRWLRAGRPPFDFFFRLTPEEQEALALIGDEHAVDAAIALGYSVRDPESADLGVRALQGDEEAEEAIALRLASERATALAGAPAGPAAAPRVMSTSKVDFQPKRIGPTRRLMGRVEEGR